ncbi:hypothetical protein JCM3765_005313 [Sporobolomyces pararoseus]
MRIIVQDVYEMGGKLAHPVHPVFRDIYDKNTPLFVTLCSSADLDAFSLHLRPNFLARIETFKVNLSPGHAHPERGSSIGGGGDQLSTFYNVVRVRDLVMAMSSLKELVVRGDQKHLDFVTQSFMIRAPLPWIIRFQTRKLMSAPNFGGVYHHVFSTAFHHYVVHRRRLSSSQVSESWTLHPGRHPSLVDNYGNQFPASSTMLVEIGFPGTVGYRRYYAEACSYADSFSRT